MALRATVNSCNNNKNNSSNSKCNAPATNNSNTNNNNNNNKTKKVLTATKTTVKLINGGSSSSNSNSGECVTGGKGRGEGGEAAANSPNANDCSKPTQATHLSNNVEQLFNTALKALHLPQCKKSNNNNSKNIVAKGKTNGEKMEVKLVKVVKMPKVVALNKKQSPMASKANVAYDAKNKEEKKKKIEEQKQNEEKKKNVADDVKIAEQGDAADVASSSDDDDDEDDDYEDFDEDNDGIAADMAPKERALEALHHCTCPKIVHIKNNNINSRSNIKNNQHNPHAATMTVTTTFRSSSTSALMMRPQTLNVQHLRETPTDQTEIFFREVLNAWRAKARCNVVPAERTQELFHELSFHPNERQISEMLQTAKFLARKGSHQSNGLTFGEFCVLAADLKRFRASTFSPSICDKVNLLNSLQAENSTNNDNNASSGCTATATATPSNALSTGTELRSTKSLSNVEDCKRKMSKSSDGSSPVEVFLGGSCNPTTWRADVAIPALNELGISFYNPQVSDWTPDLIELEHRAKEKARVLFFVMDSETRASAGAIEAAHIAGQNCKQLVLVLHPYKRNQSILNEQISQQEYIDLRRNQLILKELVTRRGLPVMDDIPSGLQRTKDILAGIRDPPSNIATILVVVRGAFDRVNPVNGHITVAQCQRALLYLGYAQSLVKLDNLNKIITAQRQTLATLQRRSSNETPKEQQEEVDEASSNKQGSSISKQGSSSSSTASSCNTATPNASLSEAPADAVDFDLFCVLSAYLSVLQQEIQESGCISPIKGTNVPPPPVYLTNLQGDESNFAISYFSTSSSSKNISRNSSQTSVPGASANEDRHGSTDLLSRSRDSGTSSPQPLDQPLKARLSAGQLTNKAAKTKILVNIETIEQTEITTTTIQTAPTTPPSNGAAALAAAAAVASYPSLSATHTQTTTTTTTVTSEGGIGTPVAGAGTQLHVGETASAAVEEESDSNDSVFSSSSSINSVNCHFGGNTNNETLTFSGIDFRDVYLGGSCYIRSKWRQDIAIPYLKSKGITFHLPALHESLPATQMDLQTANNPTTTTLPLPVLEDTSAARPLGTQERSLKRTRRKYRGAALEMEEEEELTVSQETYSFGAPAALPTPMRNNLYNPALLDASRVLLFVITNETRSLAPMTLAAHCIGLMYNVVLAVQMLPDDCVINNEKLTPAAIKDYNRGRSYLIDLAKRQGVPVFSDLKAALECTVDKVKSCNARGCRYD